MKQIIFILNIAYLSLTIAHAQDLITNTSNLKQHRLFGCIEVGIPESISRLEKNKELVEEMGFANFASTDAKIEIQIRQMAEADLKQVKSLLDGLSTSLYNAEILRSDLVQVNKIKFFVTDIKGQWNGTGDVIGMFRYYFNAKGNSYNLLMKYPVELADTTKDLKDKMLQSIKIIQ